MTEQEVLAQSRGAFAQWGEQWKRQAEMNGKLYKKHNRTQKELLNCGLGRQLLCVATGYSFERDIELIKKYKCNVDIACVDKSFAALMDHGIKPRFVVIADANIPYSYAKKHIHETQDIYLIANVTSQTGWTHNWKGPVIFYVNKDNINTEKIYGEISGCKELIPASSNVGNTVVVFFTQVGGYDRYILTGYDYAWSENNYYAFGDSDKRHWMKHLTCIGTDGKIYYTSQNLHFSARWLDDYGRKVNGRIYNCSGAGILPLNNCDLEKKLAQCGQRALSQNEYSGYFQSRTESRRVDYRGPEEIVAEIQKHKYIAGIDIHFLPDNINPKPEEVLKAS